MVNVLVTGAAGFIGSNLTKALLEDGFDVTCVDNFNDYYDPIIKEKNIESFKDNVKFYRIDIRNKDALREAFVENDIQKVIHLAARAGVRPSISQPKLYADVNLLGTLNLLELARKHGCDFIFGSSSSVYGECKNIPFKEDERLESQISPYAITKFAGEKYCKMYSSLYGMNITCLRFFTVYGPNGRPDMAPYLFTKAIIDQTIINVYGDGTSSRDYTFVDDIVSGIIAAVKRPMGFEIFNLGNSDPILLMNFIKVIEEIVGKKAILKHVEMPPGDVSITYADVSKANELLDYKPKTSIDQGMKKFIFWLTSQA